MAAISASRTNLDCHGVTLNKFILVGEGAFRYTYSGTFIGGPRSNQPCVCKCFKPRHRQFEADCKRADVAITAKSIQFAEFWNNFCSYGREITINDGDYLDLGGQEYLVEPFISNYIKYTSNVCPLQNGSTMQQNVMEAFSHFTYHKSGGAMIVCDLQGRFKKKIGKRTARFELTDLAISSRRRSYGPTDMGEKGIENFFHHHVCNEFCNSDNTGRQWARPRAPASWFPYTEGTSMLSSAYNGQLQLTSGTKFQLGLGGILEEGSDDEYDDY